MKRSPIKRGKPLHRGSKRLARGSKSLKRGGSLKRGSRMRQVGKRGRAIREELASVRAEVLERARHRCERCGSQLALHVHHRLPRSRGGKHEPANLAVLCGAPAGGCHGAVHAGSPDWREWIASSKSNRERAS